MVNSIADFIAKGTGPSGLRKELRQKIKPLKMILRRLNKLSLVKTEVPDDVFGGDIIGIMSNRLQQKLQYSNQSEKVTELPRKNRVGFSTIPDLKTNGENTKLFSDLLSTEKAQKQFDRKEPGFQSQNHPHPMLSSENKDVRTEKLRSLISPITDSFQESGTDIGGAAQSTIQIKKEVSTETIISKQTRNTVFIEKLREYRRLNQIEQPFEKDSAKLTDIEQEKGNKESPSLSSPPLGFFQPRSWTEKTGVQTAQKINSFIAGQGDSGSSRQVRQTVHSDLPEKVEIQNVFNIDVKSDGDRDSTSSLSEKIADILREQALQHGIDIT